MSADGLAPRRGALDLLGQVRRGVPFDTALPRALALLADRDRRLAHEIAAGVLRRSATLDAHLTPLLPRGLSSVHPTLLDILHIGAYQLLHLDRVPAHAAVATSVSLARETRGRSGAGFVNAVLRRVAEAGPAAGDEEDDLPLADLWSHPRWLVARWVARFGLEATERLLAWNNTPPPLVVQPARSSMADLRRLLEAHGIGVFSAPWEAGLVVDVTRPDALPGYRDGAWYVQDPAQALVLRFAAFPAGVLVYDACAAPGGKSLGLRHRGHPVLSADRSRKRLPRLRENLARAGAGRGWIVLADASAPPVRTVSACLLDVPCLGTGTFARHPDARLRVSQEALDLLVRTQQDLLDAAADRIAPGGVLCYATCSLEPEEDEDQVNAFLRRHPAFRREPPAGFPADLLSPLGDLTLLPQEHGTDGAFAARLVRTG